MEEICLKLNLFKNQRGILCGMLKMTFQSNIQNAILSVLLFLKAIAKDPLQCIDFDTQTIRHF